MGLRSKYRVGLARCAVFGAVITLSAAIATVNSADSSAAASVGSPAGEGAPGLPDGRVYEQVSPPSKNGNEAGVNNVGPQYGVMAGSGEGALYYQTGPFGTTESGIDFYSFAHRGPGGWSTRAVLPSAKGFDATNFFYSRSQQLSPAADFEDALFATLGTFTVNDPPVQEGAESSEGIFATRAADTLEPAWLSEPAIAFSEAKPKPGSFGKAVLGPVGASPDLSTVYFNAKAVLVAADASRAPHVASNGEGPAGFYEWHSGALVSAGVLPNGEVSQYGATAAATPDRNWENITPGQLDNQVSSDGTKAFFVSPDPRFAVTAGTPSELYVREQSDGGSHSELVSRDELSPPSGTEPAPAPGSGAETAVTPMEPGSGRPYVYASPDGSHAFFESQDKLAKSMAGAEPEGEGPWTYEFDTETDALIWLPGVIGPILSSAVDGSSFIFEKLQKLPPQEPLREECELGFVEGPECEGTLQPVALDLWAGGAVREIASWSSPSIPTFSSARATTTGSVYVFDTDAVLAPGSFANSPSSPEVYRYDAIADQLTCLSCASGALIGTRGAVLSNDETQHALVGSRGMSSDGSRVFFDTARPLVTQDTNGRVDVYEWEQEGVGSCPQGNAGGCIYLISTGTATANSYLLDNGESGDDVIMTTDQGLRESDEDGAYDVYDARAPHVVGEALGFVPPTQPPQCTEACQTLGAPAPAMPMLVSAATGPSGNLVPPPPVKTKLKSKPLTRAQRLRAALKACHPRRSRARRLRCEHAARARLAGRAGQHVSRGAGR